MALSIFSSRTTPSTLSTTTKRTANKALLFISPLTHISPKSEAILSSIVLLTMEGQLSGMTDSPCLKTIPSSITQHWSTETTKPPMRWGLRSGLTSNYLHFTETQGNLEKEDEASRPISVNSQEFKVVGHLGRCFWCSLTI